MPNLTESFTATLSDPFEWCHQRGISNRNHQRRRCTAPIISVSDISVCPTGKRDSSCSIRSREQGASYLTSTVSVNTVDGTATTTDSDYVGILTPGGQRFSFINCSTPNRTGNC
ncbi:MAG: hypothetical protein IPG22_02585 [Acidobacteria bacterium]|nr:hypothetical protein [Acidobacteriota bacterium]